MITLFNERGEVLDSGEAAFGNGKLNLRFPENRLKNGIYYLHLNQGQETKIVRLLKR